MMIREVLQTISGAGIYATISLVLFVCSFLLTILPAFRMSRSEIDYAKHLPLDESEINVESVGQAGDRTDGLESRHGQA